MAPPEPVTLTNFLARLRDDHRARLPADRAYETMMYQAANPPTRDSLTALIHYLDTERDDGTPAVPPQDPAAYEAIGDILAGMTWPDPSPLTRLAAHLPGWDTLHVSTLMHAMIPDYPIFGPREQRGAHMLDRSATYTANPEAAVDDYGTYIQTVRDLREAARFDQVPESHHYLTRIVQAALEDLGRDA